MGFLDKLTGFGTKLSGAVSPFLSLGSAVGSFFGNKNIDKQIKAQQTENQKNRDYNLMLAQMQNSWSQDQWERENEYNLPINQRKRLEDAGLNPDLMYGNGGIQNIGASSPSMTSGAPSSPTDMSPLGQKKTVGDMIRDSLSTRMAEAQIKATEAQTNKTNKEAGLTAIELRTKESLESMFGDIDGLIENSYFYHNPLVQKELAESASVIQGWKNAVASHAGIEADSLSKKIESQFKEREMSAYVDDLSNKSKISREEAKNIIELVSLRIAGLKYDNDMKNYETSLRALLDNDSSLKPLLQAVRYLRDSIF